MKMTSLTLVRVTFICSRLASQASDSPTRVRMNRLIRAGRIESANNQRQDRPSTSLMIRNETAAIR